MSIPIISGIPMPQTNGALTTAGAFLQAFNESSQLALQKERQASDLQFRDKQMQRQDQLMTWEGEDRAYAQSQRPMQEKMAQMSLAAQSLNVAQQSQNLQLGQMHIGDQLQRKQMLSSILGDMQAYGQQQQSGDSGDLIDRVKGFEGFSPTAYGDYKQQSIGYGTRAKPGETTIDDATADARLREELQGHSSRVDQFSKKYGFNLTASQKDALTSFDYNTGAVDRVFELSGGDISRIPAIMQQWRKAGGEVLPGLVKRREEEARWFQNGEPIVSTPTGVPVYAAAAASSNPTAVISQAFSPQQQKFLSHYDNLQLLAQEGQGTADGMQAAMMMQQMERNPEFQAALGQRQVLLETAKGQAMLNRELLGARQDQLIDFSRTYPQFGMKPLPNGQILPINALTGRPLNMQEQAAFGNAFQRHAAGYRPSQARKIDASVYKQWGDALQAIQVASSMTAPTSQGVGKDGKPYPVDSEQMAKYQEVQGRGNAARMQIMTLASTHPELANLYQVLFPPAPQPDPNMAAPAGASGPASVPQAPPAKRITTSAERKAAADNAGNAAKWTEAKQSFGKAIELDYPDSGSEDPEANAALALAMDVYANSGPKRGDYRGPEGRNKALKAAGWDGYEKAFDDTSRWGLDAVKRHEVVTFWAEDMLRKYNYLGQGGATQPRQIHRGLTPEQARALPSGSLVEDQEGVLRTVP